MNNGIALALLALVAAPAAAGPIVDTGLPPHVGMMGMGLDGGARRAGKFHTRAATLTSAEFGIGAIGHYKDSDTRQLFTFHVVLYEGSGAIPGKELYSAEARFNGTPGWHGVTGINWPVPEGDYFIAIESRDGDACECTVSDGVPNPLAHYASAGPGRAYRPFPGLNLAIRVTGKAAGPPR